MVNGEVNGKSMSLVAGRGSWLLTRHGSGQLRSRDPALILAGSLLVAGGRWRWQGRCGDRWPSQTVY